MVDGRVEEGRFIEPSAYAAYLRGAIAEAHGDFGVALTEYQNASKVDPADPEIWTRIGEVRCKVNPHDLQARVAIREALIRDEDYAPAWEARASCEAARDVDRVDVEMSAARGAELDPKSVRAQTLLASVEEKRDVEAARKRLVALTLSAGDDASAWSALGNWAASHGDTDLEMQAFSRVAMMSPTQWKSVADACETLAGDGSLREARSLAGVLADAQHRLGHQGARAAFSIARSAVASRLAVDDALVQKNGELARARASTGRVPLDEVAGRAALLGEMILARELANELALSDPRDFSANVVLSAIESSHSVDGVAPSADAPTPAAIVVAAAASPSKISIPLPIEPIFPGDSLVADAAAKLAAQGNLDPHLLSGDAEVDAEVRSGKIPQASKGLDARHRFLACAFQTATPPSQCDSMTHHFDRIDSRDLLVNVALAHLAIRRGAQPAELKAIADRLRILGPNDPLAIATLHDLGAS
jgi:tetratricopeptide (TPR) repeat protein